MRSRPNILLLLPLALHLAGASGAPADVLDSAAAGFTSRNAIEVSATPERVWQALTEELAGWWNPDHTFSADADNMSLEARAQGCLCEGLAEGGSVRHMQVVYVQPRERMVMVGGLGPLQQAAATGAMTWALSEDADSEAPTTHLELVYQVSGYRPDGMASWAQPVDAVLADQLQRLERYIESGKPD